MWRSRVARSSVSGLMITAPSNFNMPRWLSARRLKRSTWPTPRPCWLPPRTAKTVHFIAVPNSSARPTTARTSHRSSLPSLPRSRSLALGRLSRVWPGRRPVRRASGSIERPSSFSDSLSTNPLSFAETRSARVCRLLRPANARRPLFSWSNEREEYLDVPKFLATAAMARGASDSDAGVRWPTSRPASHQPAGPRHRSDLSSDVGRAPNARALRGACGLSDPF